ncbi:MAG TPA: hypothetical protein VHV82_18535 [Sporichthyaceae bacterium]|jgi:hypothetical protein|nr:hypothetical protein [Sporichthyaceae bacterium]
MLLVNARRDDHDLSIEPPALGARRLAGPRLREHRQDAAEIVTAVTELKQHAARDTLLAAAALADSVILAVNEVVGHDLGAYRDRFSEAGHFGGLLAAAEERRPDSAPDLTAPPVAAVLACVEAQFSEADQLAEQLSRWMLGAGYFLVRSGSATRPLIDSLRADLARLLGEVDGAAAAEAAEETPAATARLPRPSAAPDSVIDEVSTPSLIHSR